MRSICKKVIAFCLVAALALTCFAGALSVSAETYNATISIDPVAINEGDAEAAVILKITSSEAGINEALFQVSSTIGAVAAEATIVDAAGAAVDAEAIDYYIAYAQDATNLGTFYLSGKTIDSAVTSAYIKVVFAADKAKAGTYPVAIDVTGVKAASSAEDIIVLSYVESEITVKAPHVHNEVWTSDEAGNHTSSCDAADCDGFTPVTEACADGEDEDLLCDKCGYDMTPAEEECQHVYDATDAINYVNFTAEGIEYYEICSECDEHIVTSTDASETAVTVANKVDGLVAYSAINVTTAGSFSTDFVLPADYEDADVKFAYVDEDTIKANGLHSSLNDDDLTNGENPFDAQYTDGVASFDVDFSGIFIAFIPQNVDAINAVNNVGLSTTYSAESKITLVFYLRADRLLYNGEDVFESLYGQVTHHAYTLKDSTNTEKLEYETIYVNEDYNTSTYLAFPYAVAPMQMGDNVDCAYYGVVDGVDYLIRVKLGHSVIAYAASSSGFSGADSIKATFLADMLNYGTEVQKYFGYRTNAYINEDSRITSYMTNASKQAANIDDVETVKSSSDSSYVGDTKLFGVSKSFTAESITELDFIVNFTGFTSVYGEDAIKDVTYKFEVDGVLLDDVITFAEGDGSDTFKPYSTGRYMVICNTLTSIEYGKAVVLHAYYNGDQVLTSTYSVYTHNKTKWTDNGAGFVSGSTSGAMNRALYYYGVSATAHFIR